LEVNLKHEFLKLLKEDEEFRYAVAGLIGLDEILKRLDRHEAILARQGEELVKLREDMNKLREDMNKGFLRHDEELAKLRADMIEGFLKHDKEVAKLRGDFNAMLTEIKGIKVSLERVTISEEEEVREVVGYRLREEYGVDVKLERLELPELEINLYGVSNGVCVLGETTIRLGVKLVEELERKTKILESKYPRLLRPKVFKVIYTIMATPEALKLAEEKNVWVLTWKSDLTPKPS